jgi:hypothetical protein
MHPQAVSLLVAIGADVDLMEEIRTDSLHAKNVTRQSRSGRDDQRATTELGIVPGQLVRDTRDRGA